MPMAYCAAKYFKKWFKNIAVVRVRKQISCIKYLLSLYNIVMNYFPRNYCESMLKYFKFSRISFLSILHKTESANNRKLMI